MYIYSRIIKQMCDFNFKKTSNHLRIDDFQRTVLINKILL